MKIIDFADTKRERDDQQAMFAAATIYADRARLLYPEVIVTALQNGDVGILEALNRQLEICARLLHHEGAKP